MYFTQQTAFINYGKNDVVPSDDIFDGEMYFDFAQNGELYEMGELVCVELTGSFSFRFDCPEGCEELPASLCEHDWTYYDAGLDEFNCTHGGCYKEVDEWIGGGCGIGQHFECCLTDPLFGFQCGMPFVACDDKGGYGECKRKLSLMNPLGGYKTNPEYCATFRESKCSELKSGFDSQNQDCVFGMGTHLRNWYIWADSEVLSNRIQEIFEVPYVDGALLCAKSINANGFEIIFKIHATINEPCSYVTCEPNEICEGGVCFEVFECTKPEDCEGKPHDSCKGYWTCEDNACEWICKKFSIWYVLIPAILTLIGIVVTYLIKRNEK